MNQFLRALSQLATIQAQVQRLHDRYLQDAQVDLAVGREYLERLGAIQQDFGPTMPLFLRHEFGVYAHSVDVAYYQAKRELEYVCSVDDMHAYEAWYEVYTGLVQVKHEFEVWRDVLIAQEHEART